MKNNPKLDENLLKVLRDYLLETEAEKITNSICAYLKKEYPEKDAIYEYREKDIEKIVRFIVGGGLQREDIASFLKRLKEMNEEKEVYNKIFCKRDYMNINRYLKYIEEGKNEEAIKYKNSFVPQNLFKYYSLSSRDNFKNRNLDKKKINCLLQGKVYAPMFRELNDPFEGYYYMLDKGDLRYSGVKKPESFEKLRDNLNDKFRICSLSGTNAQCMPMWAYYSNNHQGYCVEYEIPEDIRNITFQVIYTDERKCANDIYIVGFLLLQDNTQNSEQEKNRNRLNMVSAQSLLSYTHKHISWAHEQEYRIIIPSESKYVSLKIKNIYIGINCIPYYKTKIIEYGRKHQGEFGVYIMEMDKNSQEFRLTCKMIE